MVGVMLLGKIYEEVSKGGPVSSVYEDGGFIYVQALDGTSREATADEIRAAKVAAVAEQIKAERDRRKGLGCTVGPHRFQLWLVMMGASMPAGIKWKTMDGTFADMTPTLAQQIFAAQAQRDTGLFAVCEQHIAGARAADDPLKYDYSAGWPD